MIEPMIFKECSKMSSSHFSFDDLDSYIEEEFRIRENLEMQQEEYGFGAPYPTDTSRSLLEVCRDFGIDNDDISLSL